MSDAEEQIEQLVHGVANAEDLQVAVSELTDLALCTLIEATSGGARRWVHDRIQGVALIEAANRFARVTEVVAQEHLKNSQQTHNENE